MDSFETRIVATNVTRQLTGSRHPGERVPGGPGDAEAGGDLDQVPGYVLERELGRGGFGTVWLATRTATGRECAVKLAHGPLDETARQRFDLERRALELLSGHPHVVRIDDSGLTIAGRPFLAMAYMAGGTAADRVERNGPVLWEQAVPLLVQVCAAVEAAHRSGIVHRDIKPENILLDDRGRAHLSDFGIATTATTVLTIEGSITASVAHAAPEILCGAKGSVQSDVYSLGSTLYALIAGSSAFMRPGDDSLVPILARIATEPVPDLRLLGVPDRVCLAVERAMAKEPEDRFPSAQAFANALRDVERGVGLPVTALVLDAALIAAVLAYRRRVGLGTLTGEAAAGSMIDAISAGTQPGKGTGTDLRGGTSDGGPSSRRVRRSRPGKSGGTAGGPEAGRLGRRGLAKATGSLSRRALVLMCTGVAVLVTVAVGVIAVTAADSNDDEIATDGVSVERPEEASGPSDVDAGPDASTATTVEPPSTTDTTSATATLAESPSAPAATATSTATTATTVASGPLSTTRPTTATSGSAIPTTTGAPSTPSIPSGPATTSATSPQSSAPTTPPSSPPSTAPTTVPAIVTTTTTAATTAATTTTTRPVVLVPEVVGLPETKATPLLSEAWLQAGFPRVQVGVVRSCNNNIDPALFDQVFQQSPRAATPIDASIAPTINVFAHCATVPDVLGTNLDTGLAVLKRLGFGGRAQTGPCPVGVGPNVVTVQDPDPKTVWPLASEVVLTVTPGTCG